ncbi:phosphotransferase [Nocardia uniformis]|uniref:Phosphotransferase n=1 Tax=Nocardia uniformis TaxID=53432 RepID=A0A849BXQ5_9NOCA|nr:phosphotransferase [Nocardia uniformis]
MLRAHSNSVYLLPHEHAVARISHHEHRGLRARASVTLTRWLADQHIPVTEPLVDEAVEVEDATVTFWRHYPQPQDSRPSFVGLGEALRALHSLPRPPISLPTYTPLLGLTTELQRSDYLDIADHRWLSDRVEQLRSAYAELNSALGVGMVHGDAYVGNTLRGPGGTVLLGDWDEAAIAPRELDLANTFQGARFGNSRADLDEFVRGYGWDVREWDGFAVLREMRDLHTLSGYIRRSRRGDQRAERELCHRLDSLRRGDPGATWHAVT